MSESEPKPDVPVPTSPLPKRVVLYVIVGLVLAGGVRLAVRRRAPSGTGRGVGVVASGAALSVPRFPPAGAAENAILAPLAEGAEFGGGRIVQISRVVDGHINVVVHVGDRDHRFIIAKGPQEQGPQRYVVFPYGGPPSPAVLQIAGLISQRLSSNARVPVPPGLQPWVASSS